MKKHGKGRCPRQKTAVQRLRGGWDKDEGRVECDHMAEGGLGENGIARPHTLVIKLKSTNFQCTVLRQEPTVIYL